LGHGKRGHAVKEEKSGASVTPPKIGKKLRMKKREKKSSGDDGSQKREKKCFIMS